VSREMCLEGYCGDAKLVRYHLPEVDAATLAKNRRCVIADTRNCRLSTNFVSTSVTIPAAKTALPDWTGNIANLFLN
jgi:hypothetical protein